MPMIETINLCKDYGDLVALDNLNLSINEGDCFGFIGPNGAGKTTTIKVLATLLKPSRGQAMINGLTIGYQNRQIRPLIGYVPDFMGAYDDMVVIEYLEFFAAAYDIHGPQRKRVVSDVLDLTDLNYKATAEVKSLSRGMQQRLSIARVLLHDPKVLLMDEPASGLDPRARIEIRELLKELRRMGKTILISSHILHELAELCNAVGIIERGDADVFLAGGSESAITAVGVSAFAAMRALSVRNEEPALASRPFDQERDGFVIGEGAAVLVLEAEEHAREIGRASCRERV